ncbi:MAG: hypothetical protein ACRDBG_02605 [Waterburya sp.]
MIELTNEEFAHYVACKRWFETQQVVMRTICCLSAVQGYLEAGLPAAMAEQLSLAIVAGFRVTFYVNNIALER